MVLILFLLFMQRGAEKILQRTVGVAVVVPPRHPVAAPEVATLVNARLVSSCWYDKLMKLLIRWETVIEYTGSTSHCR